MDILGAHYWIVVILEGAATSLLPIEKTQRMTAASLARMLP
jgi:hypothetical protein